MQKTSAIFIDTIVGLAAFAAIASAQVPNRTDPTAPSPVQSVRLNLRLPAMKPPSLLTLKPASTVDPAAWTSSVRRTNSVWAASEPGYSRRWPLRADPRRWPRLFANTTECSLSFEPILRRHWFD